MVKNLREYWFTRAILVSLVLIFVLAACSKAETSPEAVQPPTAAAPTVQPATAYPPAGSSEIAVQASPYPAPATQPLAPTAYPAAAQELTTVPTIALAATLPVEPTREIKKDLQATDPATVQLASGKLQLVEFFAFW